MVTGLLGQFHQFRRPHCEVYRDDRGFNFCCSLTSTETCYVLLGAGYSYLISPSSHVFGRSKMLTYTRKINIQVVGNSQMQSNLCTLQINVSTVVGKGSHKDMGVYRNNCREQLSSKTIIHPSSYECPTPPPSSHSSWDRGPFPPSLFEAKPGTSDTEVKLRKCSAQSAQMVISETEQEGGDGDRGRAEVVRRRVSLSRLLMSVISFKPQLWRNAGKRLLSWLTAR